MGSTYSSALKESSQKSLQTRPRLFLIERALLEKKIVFNNKHCSFSQQVFR